MTPGPDPRRRLPRVFFIAVVVVAFALGIGFGVLRGGAWFAPPALKNFIQLPSKGPLQYQLMDTRGQAVNAADYNGRVQLVFFGYTSCPDICPTTLARVASALKTLGPAADQVAPVFISVDPARDTPKRLEAYVHAFDPRLIGLTGSEPQLQATARAFLASYERVDTGNGRYEMNHTALLYVVDRDGTLAGAVHPDATPEELAAVLRAFL